MSSETKKSTLNDFVAASVKLADAIRNADGSDELEAQLEEAFANYENLEEQIFDKEKDQIPDSCLTSTLSS